MLLGLNVVFQSVLLQVEMIHVIVVSRGGHGISEI